MNDDTRALSDPSVLAERVEAAATALATVTTLVSAFEDLHERLRTIEGEVRDSLVRLNDERESFGHETASLRSGLLSSLADLARRGEQLDSVSQRIQEEQLRSLERAASEELANKAAREQFETTASEFVAEQREALNAARGELTTMFEEFRRQQLVKLDDLTTSHRLLGDRQREAEDRTTRDLNEIRSSARDLETRIGALDDRLTREVGDLTTTVGRQSAGMAILTETVRRLSRRIAAVAIGGGVLILATAVAAVFAALS